MFGSRNWLVLVLLGISLACPRAHRLPDGLPGLEWVADGHCGVADARWGYRRGPSYLGHLHSHVVAGL